MTFVLYLCGLVLIAGIATVIAAPLFGRVAEPDEPLGVDPDTLRWRNQKDEAYAVLKEALFDHQMGKLSDEDYQAVRDKYEARALEALTQLDRLGGKDPTDQNGSP